MKVMQRLEAVMSPSRPIGFLTWPTRTVPITGSLLTPTQNSSSPAVLNWIVFQGENEAVFAGFPEGAFHEGPDAAGSSRRRARSPMPPGAAPEATPGTPFARVQGGRPCRGGPMPLIVEPWAVFILGDSFHHT